MQADEVADAVPADDLAEPRRRLREDQVVHAAMPPDVLAQATAVTDRDQLHPATDPEDRDAQLRRAVERLPLRPVARLRHAVHLLHGLLSVQARVDVAAARQEE